MANLPALQAFAAAHGFGLTAPLRHEEVVRLAEYWLPDTRFYWDERFHPVALDDIFTMVEEPFAAMPPLTQEAWRVSKFVRTGPAAGASRAFDPPVVHVPDGMVPQGNTLRPVVRVLNEGTPARDALRLAEVGTNAVVTHGASFRTSNAFFGPLTTLSGGNTSAAGDPFLPRADEPDPNRPGERRPRVTVMAALYNLLDLLKYELAIAQADEGPAAEHYPPDGMRRGFDIFNSLLHWAGGGTPPPWSAKDRREFLQALIAAFEDGGQIPNPPPGWKMDRGAWNAVTRYAFLEYSFFYAYNDFDRYQTTPFENEHEGDDEGCCLVFDRNVLNLAANSSDPDMLRRAVPHSIITLVHEEYQDADLFAFIPPPIVAPGEPSPPARDVVDFTVYVAGGSHATYLTPGTHDLVDFQDGWAGADDFIPVLGALPPVAFVIALIVSIIDHFVDTEDFTSDDGIHAGPDDVVGDHPAKVASHVVVLPMSDDNHIYMPINEPLLALRAYAGKWGGHDGWFDISPPFAPKAGRFFRKLLDKL